MRKERRRYTWFGTPRTGGSSVFAPQSRAHRIKARSRIPVATVGNQELVILHLWHHGEQRRRVVGYIRLLVTDGGVEGAFIAGLLHRSDVVVAMRINRCAGDHFSVDVGEDGAAMRVRDRRRRCGGKRHRRARSKAFIAASYGGLPQRWAGDVRTTKTLCTLRVATPTADVPNQRLGDRNAVAQ